MAVWGKNTRIKLLGGEIIVREAGHSWDQMASRIEGTKRRALDLSTPFMEFQDVWFNQTRAVYEAEGLPVPWPGLSPGYSAWKERYYPGAPIGVLTGRLKDSLTNPESPDLVWDVGPRSLRYSTRVPYFKDVQAVRPPLVLLPETAALLMKLVEAHILRDEIDRSDPSARGNS